MAVLDAYDLSDVHSALLTALAKLREQYPNRTSFQYRELTHEVARVFVPDDARSAAAWARGQEVMPPPDMPALADDEDERKLLGAIWTLVADAVVYLRFTTIGSAYQRGPVDGLPIVINRIVLTERGEHVLAAEIHPLRPEFIIRFKDECGPGVPDEIVARMEDAVECIERRILRAALVMVGLAAEQTLQVTYAALDHLKKLAPPVQQRPAARKVLADIKKAADSWPANTPDEREARHRFGFAVLAAETIRNARNDASHPSAVLKDIRKVESVLTEAALHLPAFWAIPIAEAVKQGFTVPSTDDA